MSGQHSSWSILFRSVSALGILGVAMGATATADAQANPGAVAGETPPATKAHLSEKYGRLPLSFEPNRGQAASGVQFMARGQGYGLYLTSGGAVLELHKTEYASDARRSRNRGRVGRAPEVLGLAVPGKGTQRSRPLQERAVTLSDVVRMQLAGANPSVQPVGLDTLPGTANYILSNDASKWRTGVPTYARIRYEGVYPGVDLVYYGNQRRLEYDFVVAPGADSKLIRLRFEGAKNLNLDGAGNLVIVAANGELSFQKPVAYQLVGNIRRPIEGRFQLLGNNTAGFSLGEYDRTRPLVIDPVLSYSTYLGGSDQEYAVSIAVDSAGEAYVTGLTWSQDFPLTPGAYLTVNHALSTSGVSTAFISKLNASGTALLFSTYLGGTAAAGTEHNQGDYAHSIAVDTAGNAYVTGWTYSSDFPVTTNAYQSTNNAAASSLATGFISELNANGTSLLYSTYLGGSNLDEPTSLVLDSHGNVYTSGFSFSSDYPTTTAAFQSHNNSPNAWNAFVSKVNPNAGSSTASLVYSTYLGGSGESGNTIDGIYALISLAVDAAGDAYVEGFTQSTDFPVTTGVYQNTNHAYQNGGTNVTLSELNPTGTALIYSTYLGGSSYPGDFSGGVAIDGTGNAYLTGYTYSSDFPTTTGAYQTVNSGAASQYETVFVTEVNPTGTGLVYSTFLGGSTGDDAYGLALDGAGDVYVTGATASSDFPTTMNAYQSTNNAAATGGENAFLTELKPDGSALLYSTFLGGSGVDGGYGVALGSGGTVYLTGYTSSSNFPVTTDALETSYISLNNTAFVAEFDLGTLPSTIDTETKLTSSANPASIGTLITFTATVSPLSGTGIPAGNLVFSIDEVPVATVILDGTGKAIYQISSLALGEHYVLASYVGNSTYASSGNGLTETIGSPLPVITSLSPFSAVAGGTGFTLTINGMNFFPGATAAWNTTPLTTTFVSATQLTAAIPAGLISAQGTANITVTSTGGTSASATFTIIPSTLTGSFPLLLALSPSSTTSSGAGFTLYVYGANFNSSSVVLWNGSERATVYVDSSQLMATILVTDIALPATNLVTVVNISPLAGPSAALSFVVMPGSPIATITGGSVSLAADGSGNHLLTLSGTDFLLSSVVQWNGASLTTYYISPWEISALLPASDYGTPGTATVMNPGGTSAGFQ